MKQPIRKCVGVAWIRKTEYIRIENGLGSQAATQNIASHANDAGESTPVRIQRGGAVVGLYFDADCVLVIERDNSRVIREDGKKPRLGELLRGSGNGGLE